MSANPKKRERHRLKRQKKLAIQRRATSGSPYRKIGNSGEIVASYITRHWRADGMVSIFVLRRMPGGGHALAAFLIDNWCMGLKDAWGRLNTTLDEFHHVLEQTAEQVELIRVDVEKVKKLVAGSIRFAHQNGFRLPPRYDRWTALLGDIGDWQSADLTDFGAGGGRLRFVGNIEDLRRRLIGCTVEQFLHRADVEFVMGNDNFTLLDDDTVEFDNATSELHQRALEAVRRWCFAQGVAPHPRLSEALDITLEATLQTRDTSEIDDPENEMSDEGGVLNIEQMLALEDQKDSVELQAAMAQIGQFMHSFESPAAMLEAIGFDRE